MDNRVKKKRCLCSTCAVDDYDRETRITLWVASSPVSLEIETIEAGTEMETGTGRNRRHVR